VHNFKKTFREVQNFRQWWLWLIVIVSAIPTLGVLLYQVVTGQQIGDKPASNTVLLALSFVVPVPMFFVLYFAKLTTIIDCSGIEYGWNFPSSDLNFIAWKQVRSIELVEYDFVGYGFRMSRKYGLVYNTAGNKGLQIITTTGKRILLGTLKSKELERFLQEVGHIAEKEQG
jgi:hypothetical protein